MKNLIFISVFLITSFYAFCQDKETMAKIYYTNAEEFFNKKTTKDYENCVTELEKAEDALGTTNSKILYLKIKGMYEFSVYYTLSRFNYYTYDIGNSLETFFKITDTKSYPIEKYAEIVQINDKFKAYKTEHPEKLFSNYRHSIKGLFEKGDTYLVSENQDFESATAAYLEAIEKDTTGIQTASFLSIYVKIYYANNKSDAEKLYKKAAEKGNISIMITLANKYQEGAFGEVDCKNAILWYTKSAEKGNYDAMWYLGNLYSTKEPKNNKCFDIYNINTAIKWYLKPAEFGYYQSMVKLADLYKKNGEKDKAKEWLEKAEDAKMFPVPNIGEAKSYTKNVYSTLPYVPVKTIENKDVELKTQRSDLPFKTKPTLIVTWSSKWCNPCIRKIDTLLSLGIQDTYNIILINKDDISIDTLKEFIYKKHPKWVNLNLLFDSKESLKSFDNNAAPCFIWLDKDFNIVHTYVKFTINASTIINVLDKINKGEIKANNIKFLDSYGAPSVTEDKAIIKYIISNEKNSIKFQIYYRKKNGFVLQKEFYYAQDKNGILSPILTN